MRRPLPPLNALRAFEAAARHGSFRLAGDELCVSHSAISHQVKQLEQYFGLELFNRMTRSIELTPPGRTLYTVLRDVFDRVADCTDLLFTPRRRDVLTVRLYSTFAIRWLIPRLPRFQALHPDIKFRLNTSQLDVDFEREDIDACILIGNRIDDSLHYTYLFSVEIYPVCSPALRAGPVPLAEPRDLFAHTILQVYPSRRDWIYWLEHWQIESLDVDGGLVFDSYDHALAAAREGVGVALGMQPYLARDLCSGVLVEAFPGRRVRFDKDWYFVCRKERAKEHKITAFRDWLHGEVRDDPDVAKLDPIAPA